MESGHFHPAPHKITELTGTLNYNVKPSSRCDGDVSCDDVHVWVSCKYEHVQAMVVELVLMEVEVVKVVVGEAEAEAEEVVVG